MKHRHVCILFTVLLVQDATYSSLSSLYMHEPVERSFGEDRPLPTPSRSLPLPANSGRTHLYIPPVISAHPVAFVLGVVYLGYNLIKEWFGEKEQKRAAHSTSQKYPEQIAKIPLSSPLDQPPQAVLHSEQVPSSPLPTVTGAHDYRELYHAYKDHPEDYSFVDGECMHRRLDGLSNASPIILVKHYFLSEQSKQTLSKHTIKHQPYEQCIGSDLQQIVHSECIKIVDSAHHLLEFSLQKLVVEFADISRECNSLNHIDRALRALDLCWSCIDCIDANQAYLASFVGAAMVDGCLHGCCNVGQMYVHFVRDPLESIQEWGRSVCTIVGCIGDFFADYRPGDAQELAGRVCSHIAENPYDAIKEAFCFGTETMLTHKANAVLGTFVRMAQVRIPQYADKIKKISEAVQRCAKEAFALAPQLGLCPAFAAESLPVQNLSPHALFVEKFTEKLSRAVQRVEGVVESIPAGRNALACLQALRYEVRQEMPRLAKFFDNTRTGFAEFADKPIRLAYEHFLALDLKMYGDKIVRFTGFHHDYLGALEKSGAIKFIKKNVLASGVYEAWVVVNDLKPVRKTFFPQHWTREKVVSAILEAYDYAKKHGGENIKLIKKGYKITGLSADGITIEMIYKSGILETAYPIVQ